MAIPDDKEKTRIYSEGLKKLVKDFGDPIAELIEESYGKYEMPTDVHSLAAIQTLMFLAITMGTYAGLNEKHIQEAYESSWKLQKQLQHDMTAENHRGSQRHPAANENSSD